MTNLPLITDEFFPSILTMKYSFTWHCITEGRKSATNVIKDLIIRKYPLISINNPLHYIFKKIRKLKQQETRIWLSTRKTKIWVSLHRTWLHLNHFLFILFAFQSFKHKNLNCFPFISIGPLLFVVQPCFISIVFLSRVCLCVHAAVYYPTKKMKGSF